MASIVAAASKKIIGFFSNRFPSSRKHLLVGSILVAGLEAADPEKAVFSNLKPRDGCIEVSSRVYCPSSGVYLLGFGKASRAMAAGSLRALGEVVRGGIVIAPRGHGGRLGRVVVVEGDHPIPGINTLRSSLMLLEYAERLPEDSLALILISGGGSSLFEVPAPGIRLEDVALVTRELLRRGASIWELNAVRKHLSIVKGGQFLRRIPSRHIVSLIISDVIGDRLDTIASGPTAPDETSFSDAKRVLEKYGIWNASPKTVKEWIEKGVRGEVPDTPKPGDPLFNKVVNTIIASNTVSLKAMVMRAREEKVKPLVLTSRLRGEAREAAKVLASIIESIVFEEEPIEPPVLLLAGGETTVTVKGKGVGGRSQELCLSLLIELEESRVRKYVAACMGSDGVDGVSPAAGAVIDGETYFEALREGLDPTSFLENNDSYTFFSRLDRSIVTGYTGTNVNDFIVVYVG